MDVGSSDWSEGLIAGPLNEVFVVIPRSQELGRRIRRAREDAGLSRNDLARALGWAPDGRPSGYSPRTLIRLEKGQRDITEGDLAMLAEILAADYARLTGRSGDAMIPHPGDPVTRNPADRLPGPPSRQEDLDAISAILADLGPGQQAVAGQVLGHVLAILRLLRADR